MKSWCNSDQKERKSRRNSDKKRKRNQIPVFTSRHIFNWRLFLFQQRTQILYFWFQDILILSLILKCSIFKFFLCNTIFLFCENFNVRLAYIRQYVLNHFNATIIFKGFDIDVQSVYLSVHLPLSGWFKIIILLWASFSLFLFADGLYKQKQKYMFKKAHI